jgi:hypothetical protein
MRRGRRTRSVITGKKRSQNGIKGWVNRMVESNTPKSFVLLERKDKYRKEKKKTRKEV